LCKSIYIQCGDDINLLPIDHLLQENLNIKIYYLTIYHQEKLENTYVAIAKIYKNQDETLVTYV
jgi:hypothetical protein